MNTLIYNQPYPVIEDATKEGILIMQTSPYPVIYDATTDVSVILVSSNIGLSLSDITSNHTAVLEIPTETPNGAITTFTFLHAFLKVLVVTINGQSIDLGAGAGNYTVGSNQIIFGTAPETGDKVRATYIY
jgi:hypothetical protein